MLIGHFLFCDLQLLVFGLQVLISLGKGHYFISLLCVALEKFLGVLLSQLSHLTLKRLLLCESSHILLVGLFDFLDRLRGRFKFLGEFGDEAILFGELLDDCLAYLFSFETHSLRKFAVFVLKQSYMLFKCHKLFLGYGFLGLALELE